MRGRLKRYGRKKRSSFMEYLMNDYGYVNSGTGGGTSYQNYTTASYQPPINYEYVRKYEPFEITKCGFIITCSDGIIIIKDHYQMLFQVDKNGFYKYCMIRDHDTDENGMLFIFNEDVL